MTAGIEPSGAAKPVKGRYAIELPEGDYVALWVVLGRVQRRPAQTRGWTRRIVQACTALVIAAICSRFEQSKYMAIASLVFAAQALLALVAPSALMIRVLRYLCWVAITVCLCLWPYTIPFGAISALALLLSLLGRPISRFAMRRKWRRTTHLHGPFECGFDEETIWLGSKNLKSRCRWSEVNWWALTEDWLVLFPANMPNVFFPVDRLQSDDLFDHALAMAKEHSAPYGTPPKPRS